MEKIQSGQETKEVVLQEAIEILKPVTFTLKEKESIIGKRLNQALEKAWLDEKSVGALP